MTNILALEPLHRLSGCLSVQMTLALILARLPVSHYSDLSPNVNFSLSDHAFLLGSTLSCPTIPACFNFLHYSCLGTCVISSQLRCKPY